MGNYETIRAVNYVINSESLDEKVAKLEKRVEELEKKVETPRVNLQEMINQLEKHNMMNKALSVRDA